MISASRVGWSRKRDKRFLISVFQSGMFDTRDAVDRLDELPPAVALGGQHLFPFGRQAVVTAAALAGVLHPAALNPAALLQAVEQGVERGDVETQTAARALLD